MKIILVSIGIFQEYLIDNIKNLLLHNNNDIVVITENIFFENFKEYKSIQLIDKNELQSEYITNYKNFSRLDRNWRDGFWYNTSLRMFYVHAYMQKYDIRGAIHIENDVMIYDNLDNIRSGFKKEALYCAFDGSGRVILSIIYIPSYIHLEKVLQNYDYSANDMINFGRLENDIESFPIIDNKSFKDADILNRNYTDFGVIFDAAAIGQYLGGVDKICNLPDVEGYVSPDCLVKYNIYNFYWMKINHYIWCPYIKINNELIKVINLHIHRKCLSDFSSINPIETNLIRKLCYLKQ